MRDYLIFVDCSSDKCPLPFVKTRNAILEADPGNVIKVVGTDVKSYYEILIALEPWNAEVIEAKDAKERWEILFKVGEK